METRVRNYENSIEKETKKVIRKIMSVIEEYTDYSSLEPVRKSLVRDTVLNQINRLVRTTKNFNTIIFEQEKN